MDGTFVDWRWPAFGLTVELDGYHYHASRQAWSGIAAASARRERGATNSGATPMAAYVKTLLSCSASFERCSWVAVEGKGR